MISRLAEHAWTTEQAKLVTKLRAMIARFEDTRDLRLMGGYQRGLDTELDKAVDLIPKLYDSLKQAPKDSPSADAFQDIARTLSS